MRYFIELAYNGKNYFGWQRQPKQISVQQVIEEKLSTILRKDISIIGAGRTDTGVHAKQMYAHFDYDQEIDYDKVIFKLNSFLPKDIAIYKIIKVTDDSHARFGASSRAYEYHIQIGKSPFTIDSAFKINNNLNVEKMNEAARILFDYTDFKCFSKSKTDVRTYNCDIMKAEWTVRDKKLIFHVKADRFLRNMVRAIVGSLIEVGNGKKSITDFRNIIESRSRSEAGISVPAQGLYLTEVTYPYI
ncbi:MAG: tRNA pseudouridine(38-40) synthase TruA [Flavobacteriales bacterium]|nr:tRNA pseudouridine(38-40) synthase TruA [Flavobacteriales bacterium]